MCVREREYTCAYDKELISIIYKEQLQFNEKTTQSKNWAKNLNRLFTKEGI